MNNYVLVIKKGTAMQIGRKTYTKSEVDKRIIELAKVGITHMIPMRTDEAFGPTI